MCTLVSKSKTEEFLKEHEGKEFIEAYKGLHRNCNRLCSPYYVMHYESGRNAMSAPTNINNINQQRLRLDEGFFDCYEGIHVSLTEERIKHWADCLSGAPGGSDFVVVKVKCYLSNLIGIGCEQKSEGDAVFTEVYLDEQEYQRGLSCACLTK